MLREARPSVAQVIELERRCLAWALGRGNVRVDDDAYDAFQDAVDEAAADIVSSSEQGKNPSMARFGSGGMRVCRCVY